MHQGNHPDMQRAGESRIDALNRRWLLGEPFSASEAAELLGVAEGTLRDRLRPIPPCRRLGRLMFWTPDDIRRAYWGEPTPARQVPR